MGTVTIKTEEEHLDHTPMLTIKNEEQELDAPILEHDEQHYISLSKGQSDKIAKFPEGCRVVHSVQSECGVVLACFASVKAVAMYIPTRGYEYKTTSPLAKSRFVLATELSFAPETPVWAVIAGASTYTSAIVMSHDTTCKTYTVVDGATFGKFSNIAEKLVCYRAKHSTPPDLQKELELTTATEGDPKQAEHSNSRENIVATDRNDIYQLSRKGHEHADSDEHYHSESQTAHDTHHSFPYGPPDFSTPQQFPGCIARQQRCRLFV